MNRRAFLRRTSLASLGTITFGNPLRAAETARSESDDALLAVARDNIIRFRQGDGVLVVQTPEGQPLAGAKVQVEQVSHAFRFGCNLFMWGKLRDPIQEDAYRRRFAELLNYATLGFYWPSYERVRGQPIYEYTDRVVAWCQAQGIACKGHPLVWDYADPPWLPQDLAEIKRLSDARVTEIVARFRGRIDIWDVVNEPTHLGRFGTRLGEWAQSMDTLDYVVQPLRLARAANPTATLLVNDYRVDEPFYRILDALRDDGKPLFDAVGIQSHMHRDLWSMQRVKQVCDRFRPLGLPLHFTETTVVSGPNIEKERWKPTQPDLEERQAEYVPKFYTLLFGDPNVEALTWWDFSDRGAWQGAAAGFLRPDMSPKPVYERLHDLIRKDWWTRVQGTTNPGGELPIRAFHGVQRVRVELPSGHTWTRDLPWSAGSGNRHIVAES